MEISLGNIELAKFFIAIILLLCSAHFFGYIFTKLSLPKVVGEIFGGVLIGPTLFGYFFFDAYNYLFLESGNLLAIIYWFGLILLMFSSGFELNTKFNKKDKKIVTLITIS